MIGNKRIAVHILQSYTGISTEETLHIWDQFLNTRAMTLPPVLFVAAFGSRVPKRDDLYILKSILRLANIPMLSEDLSPILPESRRRLTTL
jgi:hypothetical protein